MRWCAGALRGNDSAAKLYYTGGNRWDKPPKCSNGRPDILSFSNVFLLSLSLLLCETFLVFSDSTPPPRKKKKNDPVNFHALTQMTGVLTPDDDRALLTQVLHLVDRRRAFSYIVM